MTPQDLIVAFDTLAEAPEGVTRLRELVLQLAVRGKLVRQDPGDEPACVLLEKVTQERSALVKAKQIRKSRPQAPVPLDSQPWEVPATWAWTRFGTVTDSRLGKMLDKSKNTGPLRPYLRNANLQWFTFELDDLKELRLEEAQLDDCTVRFGDLVICEGGEPGRAAVCTPEADGMVYQKALHRARPLADISSWYLAYLLRCDTWSGRLAELFTGATIKHLTGRSLATYAIPLPPLAEQHRIVARVDELMGLLDRLEAARTARDTTRAAARDAALAALREADTPEEVEVAWNRFAERMDDLLCEPDDIEPVRQAVLQLAVRGKLVRQDPGDEPGSVQLERVKSDDSWRIPARPRRGKLDPTIEGLAGEMEPPDGWVEVRLEEVIQLINGRAYKRAELLDAGTPIIRIQNLNGGTSWYYSDLELPERQYCSKGDLLFAWSASFGPYIWWGDRSIYHYHIWKLNLSQVVAKRFLFYVLMNLTDAVRAQSHGLAMLHMTKGKMERWPLLLPPLAEQQRIVARVDELMGLLDRLKARLMAAHTTHNSFASAAVHHLDA